MGHTRLRHKPLGLMALTARRVRARVSFRPADPQNPPHFRPSRGVQATFVSGEALDADRMITDRTAWADFQVQWTPRVWMSPTLDLPGFEQQLYLRQPGYIGKYLDR